MKCVKIADFGISKRLSGTTLARTMVGTLEIMAPERVRTLSEGVLAEAAEYGPESDLWSLGVVLYELAVLKPPFSLEEKQTPSGSGREPLQVRQQRLIDRICNDEPTPLPFSRAAVLHKVVIGGLLQKPPEQRPSAADLCRDVELGRAMHHFLQRRKLLQHPSVLEVLDVLPDVDQEGSYIASSEIDVLTLRSHRSSVCAGDSFLDRGRFTAAELKSLLPQELAEVFEPYTPSANAPAASSNEFHRPSDQEPPEEPVAFASAGLPEDHDPSDVLVELPKAQPRLRRRKASERASESEPGEPVNAIAAASAQAYQTSQSLSSTASTATSTSPRPPPWPRPPLPTERHVPAAEGADGEAHRTAPHRRRSKRSSGSSNSEVPGRLPGAVPTPRSEAALSCDRFATSPCASLPDLRRHRARSAGTMSQTDHSLPLPGSRRGSRSKASREAPKGLPDVELHEEAHCPGPRNAFSAPQRTRIPATQAGSQASVSRLRLPSPVDGAHGMGRCRSVPVLPK